MRLTNLKLLLTIAIGLLITIGAQLSSEARVITGADRSIKVTDSLEEEEKQVDDDIYHGDEEQDEAYDEEKNEFINDSEGDELDYELSHEEQDLEYQEQTMEDIDAVEEDINEQP